MLPVRFKQLIAAGVFIVILFSCSPIVAQISNTVIDNEQVPIKVDEQGKITSIPGFALIANKNYKFIITVSKPVAQHKKLIAALIEKLDSTYEKLNNTADYPYAALYKYLWGDAGLNAIKSQVLELDTILKSHNPDSALAASANTFPLFISKSFLQKNLFGNTFSVTCDLDNTTHTGAYNADLTFTMNATPADDSLKVNFMVADMEKNFYRNFFTESRQLVQNDLNSINPAEFYTQARSFTSYTQVLDSIRQAIMQYKDNVVCDFELVHRYDDVVAALEGWEGLSGYLIRQMKEGWMKKWLQQWIWSLNGNIAFNPLPFTDDKLLSLTAGFDSGKAKAYDAYRESALAQMQSQAVLNDAKINYAVYDSLLSQKGTGSRVFSYQAKNDALKKANAENRSRAQTSQTLINTLTFPVVEEDQKDSCIFRFYNASDKLKGSKANDIPTISTKIKVTAVGYNISSKQTFSIRETPEDGNNQSAALTEVNKAVDGVSDLFTKAGPLPAILSNILLGFRKPDDFIPGGTILNEQLTAGVLPPVLSNHDYTIHFFQDRNDQYTLQMRDHNKAVQKKQNLNALLDDIYSKHNEDCSYLYALYYYKIDHLVFEHEKIFRNKTAIQIQDQFNNQKEIILAKADSISRVVSSARSSLAKQALLTQVNSYLALIKLVSSPEFYTLPPKKYEFKDADPGVPQYRNEFIAFADEKKDVIKNTSVLVSNSVTKKEFKRSDTYRTAPTQRLTYSLGVAYVFKSFRRSEVTISDNKITNAADEEQVRIIAALHYHLKPLILADDRPVWKLSGDALLSRMSIMAGLSFPKPLYNPHVGVAVDVWTGIKLVTGFHFYRFTDYSILNGQISDQKSKYVYNGLFAGLTIDPPTFVKFITSNLFK